MTFLTYAEVRARTEPFELVPLARTLFGALEDDTQRAVLRLIGWPKLRHAPRGA